MIPEGHKQMMPYFIVENASTFKAYLAEVFGAKLSHEKFRDSGVIMHAEMEISEAVIMLADATDEFPGFKLFHVPVCKKYSNRLRGCHARRIYFDHGPTGTTVWKDCVFWRSIWKCMVYHRRIRYLVCRYGNK